MWLPIVVERRDSGYVPGRPHGGAPTDSCRSAGTCALRAQRGAALVEFVIVFPILVTLVFSIWEAGRIFDAWMIVTNAAREGARYAVEWSPADGDITTYVDGKVMDYLNSGYGARLSPTGGDVTIAGITVTPPPSGGSGSVTVEVTADVAIFAPTPFTGFVAPGGTFPVSAWTTMYQ